MKHPNMATNPNRKRNLRFLDDLNRNDLQRTKPAPIVDIKSVDNHFAKSIPFAVNEFCDNIKND